MYGVLRKKKGYKEEGRKKEKNLINGGPYTSMAHPNFDVLDPNKKK
jgi:hypothetical protein